MVNGKLFSNIYWEAKTQFHEQVLCAWHDIHNVVPSSFDCLINQYIMYNQFIKIDNKVITEPYLGQNSINVKLLDLLHAEGTFIRVQELNQRLEVNLCFLRYNSIIAAIPSKWKEILRQSTSNNRPLERWTKEPRIIINGKEKVLSKTTSKILYQTALHKKCCPPSAIETWINMYPFLEQHDWSIYYQLPYKILTEPYFQSFQYKIINRILNTREKLYTWKIVENNKCVYCTEMATDTIEHHLIHCPASQKIWKELKKWLRSTIGVSFALTECEILFGIPINNTVDLQIINYIIILTKWYINKTKSKMNEMYFFELLATIKEKTDCHIHFRHMNNQTPLDWQDTLNSVL